MAYIDTTLAKYGFAIKGRTYTGQPYSPDDPVRDANKMVQTGGSLYCPEQDTWTYKFAKMHNGIKSRGRVIPEKAHTYLEEGNKKRSTPAPLMEEDFSFGKGLNRNTLEAIFTENGKTLPMMLSKSAGIYSQP